MADGGWVSSTSTSNSRPDRVVFQAQMGLYSCLMGCCHRRWCHPQISGGRSIAHGYRSGTVGLEYVRSLQSRFIGGTTSGWIPVRWALSMCELFSFFLGGEHGNINAPISTLKPSVGVSVSSSSEAIQKILMSLE